MSAPDRTKFLDLASGHVTALTRLDDTGYGFPRWHLTLHDGREFTTAADSQVGVEITTALVGRAVDLELMYGNVIGLRTP